jgi:hypothetical protein
MCFDGVALICADYALGYIRAGDSGIGPRIAVYIFAGASAYLNSMHAVINHETTFVRVMWAIPPISAIVVYEFHTRFERRNALAKAGKTVPPLPAMGFVSWVFFPLDTFKSVRRLVAYQRKQMLMRYAPGAFPGVSVPDGDSFPEVSDSSVSSLDSFRVSQIVSSAEIREWARGKGFRIPERGPLPTEVMQAYYTEKGA